MESKKKHNQKRKQTERKFNIRIFLYLDLAYIKNTKINYAMNKLKKLTNVTHLKVLAEIFSAYREINLVRKNDKKYTNTFDL